MNLDDLINQQESTEFVSIEDAIEFQKALAVNKLTYPLSPALHRIGALYAAIAYAASKHRVLFEPASQLLNLFVNAQAINGSTEFSPNLTLRTIKFVNELAIAAASQQNEPPQSNASPLQAQLFPFRTASEALYLEPKILMKEIRQSASSLFGRDSEPFRNVVRSSPIGDESLVYTGVPPETLRLRLHEVRTGQAGTAGWTDDAYLRQVAGLVATETGVALLQLESPLNLIVLGGPQFVHELGRTTTSRRADCARSLAIALAKHNELPKHATVEETHDYVTQLACTVVNHAVTTSVDIQSVIGHFKAFSGPISNEMDHRDILSKSQSWCRNNVRHHLQTVIPKTERRIEITKLNHIADRYDPSADKVSADNLLTQIDGFQESLSSAGLHFGQYLKAIELGDQTKRGAVEREFAVYLAKTPGHVSSMALADTSERQMYSVALAILPVAALVHLRERTPKFQTDQETRTFLAVRARLGQLAQTGFDSLLTTRMDAEFDGRLFMHAGAQFDLNLPHSYRELEGPGAAIVAIACQAAKLHGEGLQHYRWKLQHQQPPRQLPRTWKTGFKLKYEMPSPLKPDPSTIETITSALSQAANRYPHLGKNTAELTSIITQMAIDVADHNTEWVGSGSFPNAEASATITVQRLTPYIATEGLGLAAT